MPNWCENDLTITGPEKDVYAFFDEGRGNGEDGEPLLLDFNKFVPQPGTITRDMIQNPLFNSWAADRPDDQLWYYWRLQHWGTKWQPDSFQVEALEMSEGRLVAIPTWNGEAEVMVTFDTAWSPPLPVILAMSKKFPTLEFDLRYFESGCCFNGLFVCKDGEVQVDKTGEYFGDRGGLIQPEMVSARPSRPASEPRWPGRLLTPSMEGGTECFRGRTTPGERLHPDESERVQTNTKGMIPMNKTYDKQMLLDWFQQALGELKSQQLDLEGKPVPPGVEKGVSKFRSKWGGDQVVPDFNTFDFALASFQGDEEEERKKLAETRKAQFDKMMAAWKVLEELGIFQTSRQAQ